LHYLDEGRNEEARNLFETTLAAMEKRLGPTNRSVLTTTNNLAGAYSRLGQLERALEIWTALVPRLESALGQSSTTTLSARLNIGSTLYKLRRYDEALQSQRELVLYCAEFLPSGHQLDVLARTSLAKSLITRETYDEAKEILLGALEDLRAMRGANPSWTRNAASLLVSAYERSGEAEKAEPYRELAKTGVAQ